MNTVQLWTQLSDVDSYDGVSDFGVSVLVTLSVVAVLVPVVAAVVAAVSSLLMVAVTGYRVGQYK